MSRTGRDYFELDLVVSVLVSVSSEFDFLILRIFDGSENQFSL